MSAPRAGALRRAGELLGDLATRDAPLGALTTYRVGGNARLMVRVDGIEVLARVGEVASETGVPVLVVGRGSNMLVADGGFDGIAVTFGEAWSSITVDDTVVTAGANTLLPVLARRTAACALTGLEWAVGVPGSVGGAVRMNAGGHGSDVAATLLDIVVFDLRAVRQRRLDAASVGLSFRSSRLDDDEVVLSARFGLEHRDAEQCEAQIAEIVRWRREHQPGGQNAGSVFVNPVPGELAAGQIIDELGLRGFRIGSAHVSEKHANFIQAAEGGSADDVRAVMDAVRLRVLERRGIALRSEIRLVGFRESST